MEQYPRNGLRSRNRRRLIGAALAAPATVRADSSATLRFGTTPVFLDDQISLLAVWQTYLARQLQQPVRFVQRANYRGVLDGLLRENAIAYLKWDMNRDLVHAVSGGRGAVHRQTLALYALIDRLRAAHPHVEIEACASGGARADYALLARTDAGKKPEFSNTSLRVNFAAS